MDGHSEIIALLLGESDTHGAASRRARCTRAQRLVRDASGHVSLEDVESQEEFDRAARITGCFIRGKAIRDPETLEIIGYEMEEVAPSAAVAAG